MATTGESEGRSGGAARLRYARPLVDIQVSDTEVTLLADLPGARKEDLDVRIEGDELVMEARVPGRAESESRLPWGYHRRFHVSAAVDRERITARLEDGVLRVTLPKKGAGEARKVTIE